MDRMRGTFGRQAIPMVWDFAEANPLGGAGGDLAGTTYSVAEVLQSLINRTQPGFAAQADATNPISGPVTTSTDPPYYDNIGYSDLSDFFYVWLRRALQPIYPELFGTLLTPKSPELIASPYRFDGSKLKAQEFFEQGLGQAFTAMRSAQDHSVPMTVYYGFKQTEAVEGLDGTANSPAAASTGWETMLEGLLRAGFSVGGTWLMRSELGSRMLASGTNALASSILLVCRPRPDDAAVASRRDFVAALRRELPDALRKLQAGNIAPVDLAQAAIGPGMAVYSRYRQVTDASGQPLSVRQALQIINQMLDEVLSEQEGAFDPDTRWAVTWFEQRAFEEGPFGDAQTLATARNVGVNGLADAGMVQARGGKVRLVRRNELPTDWDPTSDSRLTVWGTTQHLIRALDAGGEAAAGALLARIIAARAELAETARDLAYRLYLTCERKKWAQEALAYNSLVVAWPSIQAQSAPDPTQQTAFA